MVPPGTPGNNCTSPYILKLIGWWWGLLPDAKMAAQMGAAFLL